MNPVQGTPVYTAEKYTDLRELMVRTCEKYSELDAFIFRRSPKLSEIHRSFFEFGNDIKGLATYLLNSDSFRIMPLCLRAVSEFLWTGRFLKMSSSSSW